jgi:hypothetical protein
MRKLAILQNASKRSSNSGEMIADHDDTEASEGGTPNLVYRTPKMGNARDGTSPLAAAFLKEVHAGKIYNTVGSHGNKRDATGAISAFGQKSLLHAEQGLVNSNSSNSNSAVSSHSQAHAHAMHAHALSEMNKKSDVPQGLAKEVRNFLKKLE